MGSVRVDRSSWWLGDAAEHLYDESSRAYREGRVRDSCILLVEASKAAKANVQAERILAGKAPDS